MFCGIGIFPAVDLAFNFSLILMALIAMGVTSPDFNFSHKIGAQHGTAARSKK